MKNIHLAIIGFGNVGQGFTQILDERGEFLARRYGIQFRIVAVNDMLKGCVYHPGGISPQVLLGAIHDQGTLSLLPTATDWDALTTIEQCEADAVLEASYTDLETAQPATSHIRRALETGKHVVTSNKGPIALHLPTLRQLAQETRRQIGFEGIVMSGTPALRLGVELLAAGIRRIEGILNGTSNFILTQMEAGESYSKALAQAQALGFAEADPSGDVEGYDAAGKAAILSAVLFNHPLSIDKIDRQGITGLTESDIQMAKAKGKRWKLIARIEKESDQISASVLPEALPLEHPLAGISGALNAITYTTDLLGKVTLAGPGAGRAETGYALLNDLMAIFAD